MTAVIWILGIVAYFVIGGIFAVLVDDGFDTLNVWLWPIAILIAIPPIIVFCAKLIGKAITGLVQLVWNNLHKEN